MGDVDPLVSYLWDLRSPEGRPRNAGYHSGDGVRTPGPLGLTEVSFRGSTPWRSSWKGWPGRVIILVAEEGWIMYGRGVLF